MNASAAEIAAAIRSGSASARETIEAALARIAERDRAYNAFTDVTSARALARAEALDQARASGATLGPLAGVPFAAKNLFDIAGLPTPRRIKDQPRPCARHRRCNPGAKAGSGGGNPPRRA